MGGRGNFFPLAEMVELRPPYPPYLSQRPDAEVYRTK